MYTQNYTINWYQQPHLFQINLPDNSRNAEINVVVSNSIFKWSYWHTTGHPVSRILTQQKRFLQCDVGSLPDLLTHKRLPEIEKVETLETQ